MPFVQHAQHKEELGHDAHAIKILNNKGKGWNWFKYLQKKLCLANDQDQIVMSTSSMCLATSWKSVQFQIPVHGSS